MPISPLTSAVHMITHEALRLVSNRLLFVLFDSDSVFSHSLAHAYGRVRRVNDNENKTREKNWENEMKKIRKQEWIHDKHKQCNVVGNENSIDDEKREKSLHESNVDKSNWNWDHSSEIIAPRIVSQLEGMDSITIFERNHAMLMELFDERPNDCTVLVDVKSIKLATVMALMEKMKPRDAFVAVQTSSFLQFFEHFRWRITLSDANVRFVEHSHLGLLKEEEQETYLNACSFSPIKFAPIAHRIKDQLDCASQIKILGSDAYPALLSFGQMEPALINNFDDDTKGSLFPIGEVFTEAKNLASVNGQFWCWAFPDTTRRIKICEPFLITIAGGLVIDYTNAPQDFKQTMEQIKAAEGGILVREFGVGLNPAIGPTKIISDPFAFERQAGLHLSFGKKHTVFKKRLNDFEALEVGKADSNLKRFERRYGKYHFDVYCKVDRIQLENTMHVWSEWISSDSDTTKML